MRLDTALLRRHPLLEFILLVCPTSDLTRRVYSHLLLPAGFGGLSSRSFRHAPFLWFCTTSTVYSASGGFLNDPKVDHSASAGSGLVASQYRTGFAVFLRRPYPTESLSEDLSLVSQIDAVPHSAVHTPRRSPLPDSRTASPRPLPPCCCAFVQSPAVADKFFAMTLNFEALLRLGVRRENYRIAGLPHALLPWALFPSKVLESRLRVCPAGVSTRCSPPVSTVVTTASLLPFAHRWLFACAPKNTALPAIAPSPTDRLARFLEPSDSVTSLRQIRPNTSKLASVCSTRSLSGGVRSHSLG